MKKYIFTLSIFGIFLTGPVSGQVLFHDAVGYEASSGPYIKEIYVLQSYDPFDKLYTVFYKTEGQGFGAGYQYYKSLADGKQILKECEKEGGVLEKITIKAGSFDACKVPSQGNTFWYGEAPLFAILKVKNDKGHTVEMMCFETIGSSFNKEACYP